MTAADKPRDARYAAGGGEPFSWRVVGQSAAGLQVELRGEIDENAELEELRHTLRGDVELGLEGVTRINSCGVREWVNFMRGLDAVRTLWFVRCSPPVVLQLNTIFNFRGRARVRSFLAPYVCERCHTDEYKLLDVEEHFGEQLSQPSPRTGESGLIRLGHPHAPHFTCRKCGGVMVFDELPERYLSFLDEDERRDALPEGEGES